VNGEIGTRIQMLPKVIVGAGVSEFCGGNTGKGAEMLISEDGAMTTLIVVMC
jgi:hypothetical protein